MQYRLNKFNEALHESQDYAYAISQLNVSRARLAIAIDKWNSFILENGPSELECNLLAEAKEKYDQVERAVKRLTERNFEIVEKCGICPFCRIPLEDCGSDHK
jgi:hypothetical protein